VDASATLSAWVGSGVRRVEVVVRGSLLSLWRGALAFYNSYNLTHASSIAYFALLSLFPCLMLLLSILGSVTVSESERAAVLDFVFRYFPRQFEFVTGQLDAFRSSRVPLGIAGSLLAVWASLGVFGAITTAINHAWGVERLPSYWQHKLVSFLMLVAAGVLLLAALLLISAHGVVRTSSFAGNAHQHAALVWLGSVAARWATTMLFIVVVGLIFYFVPNTTVRFRDVWFAAVVTGLLWHWALRGFSWYVRDLSRFSIHGSIAAVVVFLLWVYISAVILLYGAEVAAEYTKLRRAFDDRGDGV
jgi:membrane protein